VISAVIPTYRGRLRLERNLPSVVASLEQASEPWEIVVVDDGGGGLGSLPRGARIVALPENRGYGPAVNAGARAARGDDLLVLNDDVRLEPATVSRLRASLAAAPRVFAVVPAIRSNLARCGDEGGKAPSWEAGMIEVLEAPADATHPTLYPVGCCFLCPREAFLSLGGYDDVYAPFLWEDVDLGYRAWRRGLATLHVPEAVCHHEGSATLSTERTLDERERMSFRNRVLFHLRNLRDPGLRAENLGAWAAHSLFDGREQRRRGLEEAMARFEGWGRRDDRGAADASILTRSGGR
jgi:GT2 family glycosyltransferase